MFIHNPMIITNVPKFRDLLCEQLIIFAQFDNVFSKIIQNFNCLDLIILSIFLLCSPLTTVNKFCKIWPKILENQIVRVLNLFLNNFTKIRPNLCKRISLIAGKILKKLNPLSVFYLKYLDDLFIRRKVE